MDSLEIVVALLRGVHLAALMSLFGTLLFLAVVLPGAMTADTVRNDPHAASPAAPGARQRGMCTACRERRG